MSSRWPVDEPASSFDQGTRLVGEVLVLGLQGPDGQEAPEDLVGLCSASLT
jgi:hypothetical protein